MSATPYATTLPVSNRQVAVATLAACMGWALDLFDLFVLLYVAPYVGRLFFPSAVPTLSLAAVYASFAVTLLMRPVGSALFGSYADRNGRKGAMVLAVTGVGISTAAFGPAAHHRAGGHCRPCPVPGAAASAGRVRRRRGGQHPHHRHRERGAPLARADERAGRRRRGRAGVAAGVSGVPGGVGGVPRRRLRGVGLARDVLLRPDQLATGLVRVPQPGRVAPVPGGAGAQAADPRRRRGRPRRRRCGPCSPRGGGRCCWRTC